MRPQGRVRYEELEQGRLSSKVCYSNTISEEQVMTRDEIMDELIRAEAEGDVAAAEEWQAMLDAMDGL